MPIADSERMSVVQYLAGPLRFNWRISKYFFLIPLVACSMIPNPEKSVAGEYCLIQWEDGTTYHLVDRGASDGQRRPGTLEGAILQLGWSDSVIVANRRGFDTTTNRDWIVIDVRDHVIQGPVSEEVFAKMKDDLPAIRSIRVYAVEDAWKILK
jgi:hypothetical protein